MKLYTLDNKFIEEVEYVPPNFTGISIDQYKKFWYLNGKYHRLDGPAIEWASGSKQWIINGKLHRLDGPACEWFNGTKEWYINGKQFTESQCKLLCDMMKLKGLL